MIQSSVFDPARWQRMTLADQLGNVGSEYERASKWREEKNISRFSPAFRTFLELLDLTINDRRWSYFRKKELLRLREESCAEFLKESGQPSLKKYFYNFALLARKERASGI